MNNKEISKYIALSDRQTEFEFTVKNNYDFSLKRQNIRLDLIEEADGFLVLSYKGLRYPVEIVSRKQNDTKYCSTVSHILSLLKLRSL